MTREEATKYLKSFKLCIPYTMDAQGVFYRAVEVAIKALEQLPCKDAISREAVVQWLKNATDDSIEYAIDSNLEFIPSVLPTQNWIPVNEKLPEQSTGVLVWCPERKNIYCACYEEKQWWIFGSYWDRVTSEVVAWMPLPKPPYNVKDI